MKKTTFKVIKPHGYTPPKSKKKKGDGPEPAGKTKKPKGPKPSRTPGSARAIPVEAD
jgi:hypothetical protein